jgi:hypothetical protein
MKEKKETFDCLVCGKLGFETIDDLIIHQDKNGCDK